MACVLLFKNSCSLGVPRGGEGFSFPELGRYLWRPASSYTKQVAPLSPWQWPPAHPRCQAVVAQQQLPQLRVRGAGLSSACCCCCHQSGL